MDTPASVRTAGLAPWLRLARWVLSGALAAVVALALALAALAHLAPAIGHPVYVVGSGSMAPTIPVGSAIVLDRPDPSALRVGDVVTLRLDSGTIFTHRVTRLVTEAGVAYIETKGDANGEADPALTPLSHVVGRVALALPVAGYLTAWLAQPVGLATVLLGALTLLAALWLLDDEEDERDGAVPEQAHDDAPDPLLAALVAPVRRPGTSATPGPRRPGYRPRTHVPYPPEAAPAPAAAAAAPHVVRRLGSVPLTAALVAGLLAGVAGRTLALETSSRSVGGNTLATAASFCASPGSQTLNASADSYVYQASAGTNYGTATRVYVQAATSKNERTLVMFALPTAPHGCAVTAATLQLYTTTSKTGRTYQAYQAAAAWTETGVTWTNQPGTTGTPATASTVAASAWISWTVTSQVQAMYAGSNFGFLVKDATESTSTTYANAYDSREGSTTFPPQLVITWG